MDNYIKELMYNLSMELLEASDAYYNGLPPVMQDATYDNKFNLLKTLESKYPEYKLGMDGSGLISPTEKVGASPKNAQEVVKHESKQLSLDKRYTADEVVEFIGSDYPVVGSHKADGLTVVLTYKDRILCDAVTLGDGLEGERVLYAVRNTSIPNVIPFAGEIKVRCEAVIPKAEFNRIKEKTVANSGKPPATARNLAAGTIRCQNPEISKERGLQLHAFELVSFKGCSYRIFQLPIEHQLCFRSFDEWEYCGLYPEAHYYSEVYRGVISDLDTDNERNVQSFLNDLYVLLNNYHPKDYKARSLSVSDVIVIDIMTEGVRKSVAYFVDGLGFKLIKFQCNDIDFPFDSDYQARNFLKDLGIPCIPYALLDNEQEVRKYIEYATEFREGGYLEYDIDGLVFTVDSYVRRKALGASSTYPLYSIAYKFANKGYVSMVSDITWQQGMYSLTPVITLDPPLYFDGVRVTKATAHNLYFLLGLSDKGDAIRPPIKADGSTEVFVERAGEVIPKIKEVYFNEDNVEFGFLEDLYPHNCPVCGAETTISGVDLVCTNPCCKGKVKAKISNMVSRSCLNLEGFGEKTIDMLVEKGFVKNVQDIFYIKDHKEKLMNLDGYGEKKVEKLLKEIRSAANVPLPNVIASLCIPGVGPETARSISSILPNGLIDLLSVQEDDLLKIEGIGETIANNIMDFVNYEGRTIILTYLYNGLGLVSQNENHCSGALDGLTFVVTGTLPMDRESVEKLIRSNGGVVTSGISSKTDYLIVGENPGKTKVNAADQNKIKQLSWVQLQEMIQQ